LLLAGADTGVGVVRRIAKNNEDRLFLLNLAGSGSLRLQFRPVGKPRVFAFEIPARQGIGQEDAGPFVFLLVQRNAKALQ
jgi:hypothetical protein